MNNNIKAIYPGTFDPITIGHFEIIKRACKIFPNLTIAVAKDTTKHPIFSADARVEMISRDITPLMGNGTKIEIKKFSGLLVDFAKGEQATVLIRGLRAASDFEYEFQMAYMNHKISPEIETIFLPANESGHFISSRFVKEMARLGGKIEGFVSKNVASKLYEYFKKH